MNQSSNTEAENVKVFEVLFWSICTAGTLTETTS